MEERSFEERKGTLDKDDDEPWQREREEEGWLHVYFPYLSLECGAVKGSPLLFRLRIKAPFTGCYLLCAGILCWASYPSTGAKNHPYKESNGWAIPPQAKEELPNLS